MTLRDLYYNYTGYPNVYEGGGFGNFFRGVGRWVKHPFNKTARYNASVQSNPDSYGSGEITNFNTTGNGTTDWGSIGGFATGQTSQNNITNPYQGTTMMEQGFAQTGTPNGETVDGDAFADISKSGKSEGTWTRGGGGVPWGAIIGAAGTNIANAFLDTEASTADRVAGALGIPALANQWRADTSKGDAYIKDMQNSMDLNSKNYIQDASSSWGGANAVKQNLKTNISPISFNSAVPSLKDFKGNWWKNMGASVAQGAASGSVGGPWGALGGAVTGLFGSIGGLFGRSNRADRAYKDFLAKRNTLVSAQEAAYNRAVKDQTLSNMQALANGNAQQRISDMANIRAFGGTLYPDGGNLDSFKDKESYNKAVSELSSKYTPAGYYDDGTPYYNMESGVPYFPTGYYIVPGDNGKKDKYVPSYTNQFDSGTQSIYESENTFFSKNAAPDRKARLAAQGFLPLVRVRGDKNDFYSPNNINGDPMYQDIQDFYSDWLNQRRDILNDNMGGTFFDKLFKRGLNREYKQQIDDIANTRIEYANDEERTRNDNYVKQGVPGYPALAWADANNNKIALFSSYANDEPTILHEMAHRAGVGKPQEQKIKSILKDRKGNQNNDPYYDRPTEIYSRLMEVRWLSYLRPEDKIDEEWIKEHKDILERYHLNYDTNTLLHLFNEVADNNVNNYNNIAAMGGNLYTDLSPNMMSLWNNKQQIDQQKVNMQQMNFGLGNSFNQKINKYDFGGSMNGMDLPTGMQSYENGGTHEENPYGGIQVGVDQQGNPNLVEEGEFRWGDYIFSDRINVDPTLLSRYNLAPATRHQGKKANKGKLSYADMAKKYAKKNNELANDPIGKNTLEAYMKRLQDAQEDQKFQDSMEQQKQDAINQYRKTLSTPTQGNPMYGAMKYNGMGNAATQQGVNAGMSDLGQQSSGNEVLSNTNRSGNNMLHAFGGNLYVFGGDNGFPEGLLSEDYKRYRESQYPTIKNNEVTLKAKPQDFTPWVSEPDVYPIDDYFFSDDSPTKFVGLSPTGIRPYIHPGASPIDTYQYTPYKSRIGSHLPVYAPHSNYAYESNHSNIPYKLRYEPQYFKHSNRIEDNYIPIEQPWEDNVVIPDRGIQGNRNWVFNDHTLPLYQSNFNSKLDTRPQYIKDNNPNSTAPAVSTYGAEVRGTNNIMYDKFGNNITLYPNGLKALNNNEYLSQLERSNPTNLILSTGTGWGIPQNSTNPLVRSANNNVEPDAFALQAQGKTADGSTADADYTTGYNGTSNTNTSSSGLTGNINTGNTTTGTYATNAFKEDREGIPLYSTAGKFATFGKGLTPMLYDWMNKTNTKYDPKQRPANELVDMGNNSTFLRTADTIGGYRAPNLMDAERMNNAAQAQGLAALQSALSVGNGNRGFAAAQANQQMYNTGMGIGNNYATAQQANNEERYKTDAYNTAIDQFNANARNTSYQDNQRAEQVGQQMALSAKQAANDYLQKENWYADRTNRTAMDNRATNQAAWTDNALNYFITQAQENAERNRQNNDITKRYWSDKDGVMHYIGDSGLNGKIREYFRRNNIDNGTFTGDRLAAFNSIIQNNKAKDVANEKGELWSTVQGLMDDEIAARNKEIADAKKKDADELQEYRDQFDSELAQLGRYAANKDIYGNYWTSSGDLDYYGKEGFRDSQSLSQLKRAIEMLRTHNDRYNKWTPQNVTAYGGHINNGNKNNKNGYYTYTY